MVLQIRQALTKILLDSNPCGSFSKKEDTSVTSPIKVFISSIALLRFFDLSPILEPNAI